jgi:hypothetical protein
MAKEVLPAVVRRDEPVTFGLIEPLNFALHVGPLALKNYPHSSVNRKLPLPTGKARPRQFDWIAADEFVSSPKFKEKTGCCVVTKNSNS